MTTRTTRPAAVLLTLVALLAAFLPTPAAAQQGSVDLSRFRNHVAICSLPTDVCDFDGVGYGYHATALMLAGVEGGTEITADDITYTWPDVPAGRPDNVTAINQVIPVEGAGATRVGFLGSSHHGPVSATVTLHYRAADGTTTTVPSTLAYSDWTLNGGGAEPVAGNTTAVTTQFRAFGPAVMPTPTYIFATSASLDPDLELIAIELPRETRIRLFDIVLA